MSDKIIDLLDVKAITGDIITEYKFDKETSDIVIATVKAVLKILESKSIIKVEE